MESTLRHGSSHSKLSEIQEMGQRMAYPEQFVMLRIMEYLLSI